jgi:hypothetical protein
MSGFQDRHHGDVCTPKDCQTFPSDCSLDEVEFASELRDLFGPEHEDLPPLYTQTLHEQAPLTTTMPIFGLGSMAGDYSYVGMQLLAPTDWSNGPIADMQYTLAQPSAGIGVLDIREFQMSSQYAAVLQIVQDGSATPVQVGATPAVCVNGSWMPFADHYPAYVDGSPTGLSRSAVGTEVYQLASQGASSASISGVIEASEP